jgi:osmotically-inducible protein OsmY
MTTIMNGTDEQLRDTVEAALRGPLGEDAPHIGVSADHGCITLTGHLRTDLQRRAARVAAADVPGVVVVENDLVALERLSQEQVDAQLEKAATLAIGTATQIPFGTVVAEVHDLVLTLSGSVRSTRERDAAERVVFSIPGIARIYNRIVLVCS